MEFLTLEESIVNLLKRCKVFIEGVDYDYAEKEGLDLLEDIEDVIESLS